MRRLLVINPNTSSSVSRLLQQHVKEAAGDGVSVQTVTARLGASYIADEASYAVAAHATLDAWAAALAAGVAPDAVLVGCFGDPGLLALRESSPVPVTGLAEGAFVVAGGLGRFAIVTGGKRWRPMLQRLAVSLGYGNLLAEVITVAPTGGELAQDPDAALRLLADACREAAALPGVQSVILGGAGLAGLAAEIQPHVPVPVIDSVIAGTHWALEQPAPSGRSTPGFHVTWQGVSDELQRLGLEG
jgi:allantoin racemase